MIRPPAAAGAAWLSTECMVFKPTLSLLVLAGALTFTHAFAAQPSQKQLQAQARVSQEQAERTALARVPNGKVHGAELEREHGKLVWSFDISQDGVSGVTEIQVDAGTGKIVLQKKESAAQEASEASREAREK